MIISQLALCEECRDGSCDTCKAHLRKKARLDADRTAKPKTRLLGHARAGDCVGPGSVNADTLEDTGTGKRTPLTG